MTMKEGAPSDGSDLTSGMASGAGNGAKPRQKPAKVVTLFAKDLLGSSVTGEQDRRQR